MKKVICSLVVILMSLFMITNVKAIEKPKVTDHEKVTIYIFRGHGCSACRNAINYFSSLGNEYDDYFEVVTYETWENSNNKQLADEVAKALEHELDGVPFIVVGNKFVNYFGDETGDKIVEDALECYQDKKYKDIVKKTIDAIDYEVEKTSLEDALEEENPTVENTPVDTDTPQENASGKYDTIIIVSIFVVLIGGMAGLVILGKK